MKNKKTQLTSRLGWLRFCMSGEDELAKEIDNKLLTVKMCDDEQEK